MRIESISLVRILDLKYHKCGNFHTTTYVGTLRTGYWLPFYTQPIATPAAPGYPGKSPTYDFPHGNTYLGWYYLSGGRRQTSVRTETSTLRLPTNVQRAIRVYDLVWENLIPVNPAHVEVYWRVTQVISRYRCPITWEFKVKSGIKILQYTPILR